MTRFIVAGLIGLAGGSCAPTTSDWLTKPADPALAGGTPRYVAVTSGIGPLRVVEPKDWRELNREIVPSGATKPGAMPGMNMDMSGGRQ